MKIQTTVQISEAIEVDIQFPHFCKYDNYFIKVISEALVICVTPGSKMYRCISLSNTSLYIKEIANGKVISEEEFENAYRAIWEEMPIPSPAKQQEAA